MAVSDLTNVAYIYKRLYSDKAVGDMSSRAHPLMKSMPKEGGFTGSAYFYAIRYGNPQGVSATFAKAQTNVNTSKGVQLNASRKVLYGTVRLDGEAMAAAEGNKGAFLELVTQETDGVLDEFSDTLAFNMYRGTSMSRGKVSAINSLVLTLTNVDDARWFKVGMALSSNDTDDATSMTSFAATVTAVDEDSGKISVSNTTNLGGSDFLFRDGEEGAGAEGLKAHLPLTAPTGGDSFRGIDRSVDARRLAGARTNDPGTSIEENIGLSAVKIAQSGKRADLAPLNPIKFWEVVRRRDAKVTYDGGGGKIGIGFEGFDLHTPAGTVRVISDPDAPQDLGYVLNLDSWYIKHLKAFPHVITDDGRPNLRISNADQIEARFRCWWNLFCTQPGANAVYAIS